MSEAIATHESAIAATVAEHEETLAQQKAAHATTEAALIADHEAKVRAVVAGHEEALEDAMVARTLKPDYMKAYYREGMCQQELGNWEEAAQAYFEGCRLENENAELIKRFQHAMRMAKEDHKARANQ